MPKAFIHLTRIIPVLVLAACTNGVGTSEALTETADDGVPVAWRFEAFVDPARGVLEFSRLRLDERALQDLGGLEAVARARAALTEAPETQDGMAGSGPADTVELVTTAAAQGSTTGTLANCAPLPGGITDCFWADVEVRSFYGVYLGNTYSEIFAMSPATGYEAYDELTQNQFNRNPALGLWRWGTLEPEPGDPGTPGDNARYQDAYRRWKFQLPPSPVAFSISGRVWTTVYTGGTTEAPHLISLLDNGDLPSNSSLTSVVSENGQYVAFVRGSELYRAERRTGEVVLVASGASQPAMSNDGVYIAYRSGSGNGSSIVRADLTDPTSITTTTVFTADATCRAQTPDITGSGGHVVFESNCASLCTGLPHCINGSRWHIYRWRASAAGDCAAADTVPVDFDFSGTALANIGSFNPSISDDASLVTWASTASNLFFGKDNNFTRDIYWRDVCTGTIDVVSRGRTNGGAASDQPEISGDGTTIVFESDDTQGIAGDTNGARDVFRHVRATTTTTVVSASGGSTIAGASSRGTTSGDGCEVGVQSAAALDAADTNGRDDVYLFDVCGAGTPVWASRTGFDNGGLTGGNTFPSMSTDGGYYSFQSTARNLSEDETGPWPNDIISRIYTAATGL